MLLWIAAAALRAGMAWAEQPQVLRDCAHCPELVRVAPGQFALGTDSDAYESDPQSGEAPALQVTIRKAFAIGRFEVTRHEFAQFLAATHATLPTVCTASGSPAEPATCISRSLAEQYLRWLSATSGQPYRLPSEAEWEYAARGGTTGARYWSNRDSHEGVSISRACDFANVYDVGARDAKRPEPWARCLDGYVGLAPVGSFAPNPFGLYDTIGNAAEHTADCFTASYKGRPPDERPWVWDDCPLTVVRGGSYRTRPRAARSAARGHGARTAPAADLLDVGLRVARDLD